MFGERRSHGACSCVPPRGDVLLTSPVSQRTVRGLLTSRSLDRGPNIGRQFDTRKLGYREAVGGRHRSKLPNTRESHWTRRDPIRTGRRGEPHAGESRTWVEKRSPEAIRGIESPLQSKFRWGGGQGSTRQLLRESSARTQEAGVPGNEPDPVESPTGSGIVPSASSRPRTLASGRIRIRCRAARPIAPQVPPSGTHTGEFGPG